MTETSRALLNQNLLGLHDSQMALDDRGHRSQIRYRGSQKKQMGCPLDIPKDWRGENVESITVSALHIAVTNLLRAH